MTIMQWVWFYFLGGIGGALGGVFMAYCIHGWHLFFSNQPKDVEYRENRKWFREYRHRSKKGESIFINREVQKDKAGNITASRYTDFSGRKTSLLGTWDESQPSISEFP